LKEWLGNEEGNEKKPAAAMGANGRSTAGGKG